MKSFIKYFTINFKMEKVRTNDDSFTCYNEDFRELYHSKSGAIEEAFKKYVEPCIFKDEIKVLDVCFGIGYNSGAAIFEILKRKGKIKIVGLENDKEILKEIKKIEVPLYFEETYKYVREVSAKLKVKKENVEIEILIGDARKTIDEVREKFDVIFLDPFSTMKNPELWSVDFFKKLKEKLKDDGILSTYSSSAIVRAGLIEAGFKIGNGPIIGRARSCTLASLKRELLKLEKEDLKLIEIFGRPFRDPDLNWSREKILESRSLRKSLYT